MLSVNHIIDVAVEERFEEQRKRSEEEVVEGDIKVVIVCLSGEAAVEGEVELRKCEYHILVEEVEDKLRVAHVIESSMDKDEPPQILELSNGEVA